MKYFVWGDGPPLVIVHGISDTGWGFIQPLSRLADHFRCVAYELPGTPGDGATLRRVSHAHLVRDLWTLLDHLELQRTYLLGSSFGSTIVLKAMHEQPQRLPRAILEGGFAHRPLRRQEHFLASIGRYLPGTTAWLPGRERILHAINRDFFAPRTPDVWKYFLEHTGKSRIAGFARQAFLVHNVDLRPILPAIRQPVLLMCGDRDTAVPRDCEEVLLAGLPNAGRVEINNCGHLPHYTHPEVFAEVARQFFTPPQRPAEPEA